MSATFQITGRGSSGMKCKTRHLKGSERERVISEIKNFGGRVERYRSEMSKKLLSRGGPRAPNHYGRGVLNNAMHEDRKKKYVDKDPIKALQKMQCGEYANEIRAIGASPFFVHYWKRHAIDICKDIEKKRKKGAGEHLKYSGDASGGMNPALQRVDGSKSHTLMNYALVVDYKKKSFLSIKV